MVVQDRPDVTHSGDLTSGNEQPAPREEGLEVQPTPLTRRNASPFRKTRPVADGGTVKSILEQLQLEDSSSRYLPGYEETGVPQELPAPAPGERGSTPIRGAAMSSCGGIGKQSWKHGAPAPVFEAPSAPRARKKAWSGAPPSSLAIGAEPMATAGPFPGSPSGAAQLPRTPTSQVGFFAPSTVVTPATTPMLPTFGPSSPIVAPTTFVFKRQACNGLGEVDNQREDDEPEYHL